MKHSGPSLEELRSSEPILRLEHHNLPAQIRPLLFRWTLVTAAYWSINGLAALFALGIAVRQTDVVLALSNLCLGMVLGYILFMPVHEWIHALTYRGLGFHNVTVCYEIRRLTAFCVADLQIVGASQFALIALAPFVVVNAALLATALLTSGTLQFLVSGALLLHLGACSGDFALINLLWLNRGRQLFTYDDVKAGESRFVLCDPPG